MNAVVQIYEEQSVPAGQPRALPQTPVAPGAIVSRMTPLHNEQIQSLVQQLFFQQEIGSVRHVGLTAAENATGIAPLCFAIAHLLSEEGTYDVGLIDAGPDSLPLETELDIAPARTVEGALPLAPHLWLVPCQNWRPGAAGQHITEQNVVRLRELAAEFDFSILRCPPLTWATARIGRACDGLVLVLTANKTRRLVASQMKDRLRKAQVPLLGTVLTERRFPIPQGLYRSL